MAPDAEVWSDGLFCVRRFTDAGHANTVLETCGDEPLPKRAARAGVNIMPNNVKRASSGRYHAIKQAKHARRYLAEAAYRFNRRFRLAELMPRLLVALSVCAPCVEPISRSATHFLR
ncbi:MAG: transposase [Dokdonella sp.]